MEAKKIFLHSIRELTANLMTTYERLMDDESTYSAPSTLLNKQMPIAQLDCFIKQAQARKYTIRLQTKQQQTLVGRIVEITDQQQLILTNRNHHQNALLPLNSVQAIQRQ